MRTLLVALLLAGAALAALPSASAAEATQPLPACVPPGVESFGVCAGTIAGNPCVWVWLGPSFNAVCLDTSPPDLLLCDNGGCQSVRDTLLPAIADPGDACVPPGVESFAVCAGFVGGDLCVWVWLGPSYNAVCLDDEGPDLLLCDNSGCSSVLRVSAAQQLPVGCGSALGVCVWPGTANGDCVGVHFGLQGAGACVDTDPAAVRVCTSMRTILYDGFCPTDGLTVTHDLLA